MLPAVGVGSLSVIPAASREVVIDAPLTAKISSSRVSQLSSNIVSAVVGTDTVFVWGVVLVVGRTWTVARGVSA